MNWTAQLDVIVSTAIAMLLGGAIGLERELKNRPAGFRTHMLVASAASLLIGIGRLALHENRMLQSPNWAAADPLRLVEAVIAGVAFIGAGTIFAHRGPDQIAGITTAATLLMVSVIGTATGFQYYMLAVVATALTLLVLTALNVVERALDRRRKPPPEPEE